MNTVKIMWVLSFLLMGSNAYGGYAFCAAGNDLKNPIEVDIVGERIRRPKTQSQHSLRPLVKQACETALQQCQIQRSQRIDRIVNRVAPPRFPRRIQRMQATPCYIQQASVMGRRGNQVYSYNGMLGTQQFKRPNEPDFLAFGKRELALLPGESVSTKTAKLIMQKDGNLVLYNRRGRAIWSSWDSILNNSRRPKRKGHVAVFQRDGNLVVYNMNKKPVFDTLTGSKGIRSLEINERNNLLLLKPNGQRAFNAKKDSELRQ